MTIWRRVAYWIIKTTRAYAHARACDTHTQKYVTLISLPQQRASMLRYTYIACLFIITVINKAGIAQMVQ